TVTITVTMAAMQTVMATSILTVTGMINAENITAVTTNTLTLTVAIITGRNRNIATTAADLKTVDKSLKAGTNNKTLITTAVAITGARGLTTSAAAKTGIKTAGMVK